MNPDHLSVVSVDVLALHYDQGTGTLRLAVPPRTREPFLGTSALPGVVVMSGERLADAAARAIAKFTDQTPVAIGQLRTFDEPVRDPRGPSLSIAIHAVLPELDEIVSVALGGELPALGFDHADIIAGCLPLLASKFLTDVEFTRALLPDPFTSVDARNIVTALTGAEPHMGNLNRALDALPGAKKVGSVSRGRGRPTVVRSFD